VVFAKKNIDSQFSAFQMNMMQDSEFLPFFLHMFEEKEQIHAVRVLCLSDSKASKTTFLHFVS
jgi:hypothetical protein